ncbi:lipopolysaccharide biosynthesis protein [Halosimplex halobium]|uniref:lipopolysaccharide biosynthesis protein n=1 Tax=Halosimplex halobium TaxID=3396618 RepID=UPI003F55EDCB
MDDSIRSYLSGSLLGIAGKISTFVGGFATLWLLTKILSQTAFGAYTTAMSIALVSAIIAQFGFRQVVIQQVAELISEGSIKQSRELAGSVLFWITISSLCVAAGTWTVAPLVAQVAGETELDLWIRLMSGVVPGVTLVPILGGILRGRERVGAAVVLEQILPWLLRVALLPLVLLYYPSVVGIFAAIAASYYLPLFAFAVVFNDSYVVTISGFGSEILQFSGALFLNSVAGRLLNNADILLLSVLATLSETGGYRVAWSLSLLARAGDDVLTAVIQPRLSRFLSEESHGRLRIEFTAVRDAAILLGIVISIVMLLAGEHLLSLFGSYSGIYPALILLSVGAGIINPATGPIGQVLLMDKEGVQLLFNSVVVVILAVAGNVILIPIYGTFGAALSTVVAAYFFTNAFGLFQVKKHSGIDLVNIPMYLFSLITGSTFVVAATTEVPNIFPVAVSGAFVCLLLFQNRALLLRVRNLGLLDILAK